MAPSRLAALVRPLLSQPPWTRSPSPSYVARSDRAPAQNEIRATGIRHVQRLLAAAEAGALSGVALLDLALCDTGCSGSPYVTPDPFLAMRHRPGEAAPGAGAVPLPAAVRRSRPYAQRPGVRLDPDMKTAIQKLSRIDALLRTLPGRDCGACGAPTCAAFAEDVVMERAAEGECPHPRAEHSPPRKENES
jgi:hypothetical protein